MRNREGTVLGELFSIKRTPAVRIVGAVTRFGARIGVDVRSQGNGAASKLELALSLEEFAQIGSPEQGQPASAVRMGGVGM